MELMLPITLYWDLPHTAPSDDFYLQLSDQILDCRPLMLQLYDPSPVLSKAAIAILGRFAGSPVSVTLTIPPPSITSLVGAPLKELGVKELLVACDSLEMLRTVEFPPELGISYFVSSDNWRELPEVVSFCRDNKISRLVLPMQRQYDGTVPFFLDRSQQEILEHSLVAVGGVTGLKMTIHDPFLWRAFNPGIPFPQGGCQAANTMIAISPDRGVYPCPTLPVRLGEVGKAAALKGIITSSAKKELRNQILENPADCGDCTEIKVCRGGCRGRALVMSGSFDGIDQACR